MSEKTNEMKKTQDFDYPKWLYHATEKPVIVNSKQEEKDLGPGWENSPAYFIEQKEKKNSKKKSED